MQARGIIGYGEFVAPNLWASDELRSGVQENLRHRRDVAVTKALYEGKVFAAQLLKQANAMAKESKDRAIKAKLQQGKPGGTAVKIAVANK